jgi:hypothetical protein
MTEGIDGEGRRLSESVRLAGGNRRLVRDRSGGKRCLGRRHQRLLNDVVRYIAGDRHRRSYSDNAKSYVGGTNCNQTINHINGAGNAVWNSCDDGQWWSGFLSAAVALSANFKAAGTISYEAGPNDDDDLWVGAAGLYYYPRARSEIGAEILWNGPESGDDSIGGHLRFKTHFN